MSNKPRRRPSLEILEDRRLPATFGLTWPDPQHLTLSFAPDGTAVGNAPSQLSASIQPTMSSATWQASVLRAFQTWAAATNVNIGVVSDAGLAFGGAGPIQSSPEVGDIRIAARPLSTNELAIAAPFDLRNDWAGDVVLNSNVRLGNGGDGNPDLFSVALHEAGHALGLEHDETDPASVMAPNLKSTSLTSLSASDLQKIQALYGVRGPDANEGKKGNDTTGTATELTPLIALGAAGPAVLDGDVTTLTDRDVFSFSAPAGGGPLTVLLKTQGVSLLNARVSVLDALHQPVTSGVSANPLDNDVTINLNNLIPGMRYYIQVGSAQADVFGIGAFRLVVGRPSLVQTAADPRQPATPTDQDAGAMDSFANAADLAASAPGTDARWDSLTRDVLTSPTDVDYFMFRNDNPSGRVLVATVSNSQRGGLIPDLKIFDSKRNPVSFQVIDQDDNHESVQVLNATPKAKYYVLVGNGDATGRRSSGGYLLAVTGRASAVGLVAARVDTLDATANQKFQDLVVNQANIFQFDLAGETLPSQTPVALSVTIYDANLNPVYNARVVAGAGTAHGDVFLAPGRYTIRIVAAAKPGSAQPMPQVKSFLSVFVRGDLVGPDPIDPAGGGRSDPYENQPTSSSTTSTLSPTMNNYSDPWAF